MQPATVAKPGLIQHKIKPEVKQWIEQQAKEQERPQGWIANKILEEAYARAQQPKGVSA
jgi:hypothetical protein